MAESIQERLAAITPATDRMAAVKTIGDFLAELEHGTIRSATRDDDGVWHAQPWVKQGILTAFRVGVIAEAGSGALTFIDKDTMPTRRFRVDDGVRIVPGGSSVRRGRDPRFAPHEKRVCERAFAARLHAGDREVSRRENGQRHGA